MLKKIVVYVLLLHTVFIFSGAALDFSLDEELGSFASALYFFSTPAFFGGNVGKSRELLSNLAVNYDKGIYKYYLGKVLISLKKG